MKNLIFIITFALITFSLTRSIRAEDGKNKTDQASNTAEEVDLIDVMAECNKSFTTEISYIEALTINGSFPDETDKTPKCYVRCVMENTGIMSSDGVFEPKRFVAIFADQRNGKTMADVESSAVLCAERNEKCKCEKAYNFMKCLVSSNIENDDKKTK